MTTVLAERSIGRSDVTGLVDAVRNDLPSGAILYLVAETGQLWEGWIPDTRRVHCTFVLDGTARRDAEAAVEAHARQLNIPLLLESPADVIPLPVGHADRQRIVTPTLRHFDPVSASLRAIARGDEPDYHLVLRYLEHDWIDWSEMTDLLTALLPQFNRGTIAQDPAEFRRKYRGLHQMWRARKS